MQTIKHPHCSFMLILLHHEVFFCPLPVLPDCLCPHRRCKTERNDLAISRPTLGNEEQCRQQLCSCRGQKQVIYVARSFGIINLICTRRHRSGNCQQLAGAWYWESVYAAGPGSDCINSFYYTYTFEVKHKPTFSRLNWRPFIDPFPTGLGRERRIRNLHNE